MRYVVDTHALVWYLTNDTRLGVGARQVLDDPSALLVIPTIVLAEAKHISERKPIRYRSTTSCRQSLQMHGLRSFPWTYLS